MDQNINQEQYERDHYVQHPHSSHGAPHLRPPHSDQSYPPPPQDFPPNGSVGREFQDQYAHPPHPHPEQQMSVPPTSGQHHPAQIQHPVVGHTVMIPQGQQHHSPMRRPSIHNLQTQSPYYPGPPVQYSPMNTGNYGPPQNHVDASPSTYNHPCQIVQDNYPPYPAQHPPHQYSAITTQSNPSYHGDTTNPSAPPSQPGDTSASTSSPVTPSSIHSQPPTLTRAMSYEHVRQQHPHPPHMQHQDYHAGGYPHGMQPYAPPQQLPAHHQPHPHAHPHSQHPHPQQHYQHPPAHQSGNAGYESPVTPGGSETYGPPTQLYPEVNPAAPPIGAMQELPQGFSSTPSSPTEYRRPPPSSASSSHSESTESYHSAASSTNAITRGRSRRAARDSTASISSTASAAASGGAGGGHGGRYRASHGSADDSDPESELLAAVTADAEQRKEDARQQRMNAEQRRRDQLRDGYDRLQSVLPQAREKLSKVKLIECATQYIQQMSQMQDENQQRIDRLLKERDELQRRNEEISASMTGTAPPPPPVSSTSTVDIAVASASTVPSSDVNSPPNTRFGSATRDPSGNLPSAQPIASSSSGSQSRSTGGQSTSIPRSVVAGTGPPRRTRAQVHAAYAANNTHESHQGSGGSEAFREKHDSVPLIQGGAANGDTSNGGRVKADTDMPDGMH